MMASSTTPTGDIGTDPMLDISLDENTRNRRQGKSTAKPKAGNTRKGVPELLFSLPSSVDTVMEPMATTVVASSDARGISVTLSGSTPVNTVVSCEMGTDPMESFPASVTTEHSDQYGLDMFSSAALSLGLLTNHSEAGECERAVAEGTYSSDDDDVDDEHDLLAEQLQQEMEAHITTFEALQTAESKLLEANRLHRVATQATVEQVRRAREATEARDALAGKYAQLQTTHVDEINDLKRYFAATLAQRDRTIDALRHAHAREVDALRTRVEEMRGQVAALTWTERHAQEAQCLLPAELFGKLLLAESREACYGLAGELSCQLQHPFDPTDTQATAAHEAAMLWCTDSGWITRLCQHVRRTRGAAETLYACAALASIPTLINTILHSSLLEVIHATIFDDASAHTDGHPGPSPATPTTTCSACAADVGEARQDLMVLLLRCARGGHSPESFAKGDVGSPRNADDGSDALSAAMGGGAAVRATRAEAFVGAPGALALLVRLTIAECGDTPEHPWEKGAVSRDSAFNEADPSRDENKQARTRKTRRETLQAAAKAFASVTGAMPHANVAPQLLDAGAVEALSLLMHHDMTRNSALVSLMTLCTDVESCQQIIAHGAVGVAVHLLALDLPSDATPPHATLPRATPPHRLSSRGLCVELLTLLSRVDAFATVFFTVNGHEVLLQRVLPAPAAALDRATSAQQPGVDSAGGAADDALVRSLAAEVFINMLSVAKTEALPVCGDPRIVRAIATYGLSMSWHSQRTTPSPVISRALDALHTVIAHDVALATSVPPNAVDDVAGLVVSAYATMGYKAMALLYHVYTAMQTQAHGDDVLIRPAVIAAVHHIATSAHGRQLLVWASTLALGVTRGMLRQWTMPGVSPLPPATRALFLTAVTALLQNGVGGPGRMKGPGDTNEESADGMEHQRASHAALAAVGWAVYTDVLGLPEAHDVAQALESTREGNVVDAVLVGLRFADCDETIQALKALAHRPSLRPIFASLCPYMHWLLSVRLSNTATPVSATEGTPTDTLVQAIGDACELVLAPTEDFTTQEVLADTAFAACVMHSGAMCLVLIAVLGHQPTHPLGVTVLDTLLTSLTIATSSASPQVQASWFVEALLLGSTCGDPVTTSSPAEEPHSGPTLLGVFGGMMYADNTVFLIGAELLAKVLTCHVVGAAACIDPGTAALSAVAFLRAVGLSLLLDVVGSTGGNNVLQRTIATALPHLLRACSVSELDAAMGHTHALSHLAGLIETTSDPVAMTTALAVVELLVQTPAHALALVQSGALRALAELSIMQQYSRMQLPGGGPRVRLQALDGAVVSPALSLEDQVRQTRVCLEQLLAYGVALAPCLCDGGGVGVLLHLLRETESETVIARCLEILSALANGECAGDILEQDGVQIMSQWCMPPADGATNTDNVEVTNRQWAQRTVVHLCWCVQQGVADGGRTTYQHLAHIINSGGLPALIAAVRGIPQPVVVSGNAPANNRRVDNPVHVEDEDRMRDAFALEVPIDTELQRRALWAIASWLSVESSDNKVRFIRDDGLAALLGIRDDVASSELCRFARLALGKLLQVHGEDLSIRIEILRSHVADGTINDFWDSLRAHTGGTRDTDSAYMGHD